MQKTIEGIFEDIGLKISTKGYEEWITLVDLAYKKSKGNLSSVKMEDLYNIIAEKYDTTRNNVERHLRSTVSSNILKIEKYFNYGFKITNKVFLLLMIKKLEQKRRGKQE